MKRWMVAVGMVLLAAKLTAADVLTEKLQQGLFEEEANHNLGAAIKAYEAVVQQSDEERKVVATAIFRLAECYRKLGKTSEATAQYQRILRDFSDQTQLADVCRGLVPADGSRKTSIATVSDPAAVALLRQEIDLAEQEVARTEKTYQAGKAPLTDVTQAKKELLRLKRLLPENAAAAQQKKLLQEQMDMVGELLNQAQRRIAAGLVASSGAELGLKRELIALQRELAVLDQNAGASAPEGTTAAMTSEEAEALARVKSLARNSPDLLQSTGTDGLSQLQLAARNGHYSVVEFILTQNISPNAVEHGTTPPLVLAAQRGHLRIVQLLLDRGADVKGAWSGRVVINSDTISDPPKTALMAACLNGFRTVVELLLERGADADATNSFGLTALHFAAAKGRTAIAELLLKHGARPDVRSQPGYRFTDFPASGIEAGAPIHIAVGGGYPQMVELLLKSGASATITNSTGTTPLHLAVSLPETSIATLLLDRGASPNVEDKNGSTPLSTAIMARRPETIALLLARGGNVNQTLRLRNVSSAPETLLHLAVRLESRPAVEALLAAKPNMETTDAYGNTPLIQAVTSGQVEIADALLEAGANPNHRNEGKNSWTPLQHAIWNKRAVVATLLKHGANPNVMDASRGTPLSFVQAMMKSNPTAPPDGVSFENLEHLLLAHGADENFARLFGIDYTRPSWVGVPGAKLFHRGTNDYNRYTLFEFLIAAFRDNPPPFPDLTRVTLERLEGTNHRPKEIALNIADILRANDCSRDMWLDWGDRLSIPELDHPLNERWSGLPSEDWDFLIRCLTRHVQIVVKQETNTIKLLPQISSSPVFAMAPPPPAPGRAGPLPLPIGNLAFNPIPAGEQAAKKEEKTLPTFRLKEVVYGANVLRASSDPARVRVTRINSSTHTTNQWTIDLNKIATSGEWKNNSSREGKLFNEYDLWLRDGDVIEVPEK